MENLEKTPGKKKQLNKKNKKNKKHRVNFLL